MTGAILDPIHIEWQLVSTDGDSESEWVCVMSREFELYIQPMIFIGHQKRINVIRRMLSAGRKNILLKL